MANQFNTPSDVPGKPISIKITDFFRLNGRHPWFPAIKNRRNLSYKASPAYQTVKK
jgi:hypothetical protein